MTGLPRVVACMPTWNGAAFVQETLESLAAQTYPSLEIVISDDLSSDDTAQICERFAATDSRFRVVRQPRRLGWVGNANHLLGMAEGDYAFFAFHDDPVRPTYVARLVEALAARPDAVLAFSDVISRDTVACYRELEGARDRVARARQIIRRQGDWWLPNRGLFRLSAARQVGGMKTHLAGEYQADWPWLLHLALLGPFVRVPEPLIHKTYPPGSLSREWWRDRRMWQSGAVLLSCVREVRHARLPLGEEMRVQGELVRLLVWAMVHRHTFL